MDQMAPYHIIPDTLLDAKNIYLVEYMKIYRIVHSKKPTIILQHLISQVDSSLYALCIIYDTN